MYKYFLLTILFVPFEGGAQSLIDTCLQKCARQILTDGIEPYGNDVTQAGLVVMRVTGEVIANVALGVDGNGCLKEIVNGNSMAIPSGISRAVNFLAVVDRIGAGFICNTGNGIYHDNHTGEVVEDDNARWGGNGLLSLDRILDVSDVGTIIALNEAFGKDFVSYVEAIRQTGVMLGDDAGAEIVAPSDYWPVHEILGYRSPFSFIQQVSWLNMIPNNGRLVVRLDENDLPGPRFEVKSKNAVRSLSAAMRDAVSNGSCMHMKPNKIDIQVAGISNVSHVNAEGVRSCFGAAFFPYRHPLYTIGVFVNKRELPAGRIIPSSIIQRIIEYIAREYLKIEAIENQTTQRLHPAAR